MPRLARPPAAPKLGAEEGQRGGFVRPEAPDERTCRLCWGEAEPGARGGGGGELLSPCACAGSLKWIHRRCLADWQRTQRSQGQGRRAHVCELCKTPYRLPAAGALARRRGAGPAARALLDAAGGALSDAARVGAWPRLAARLWRAYVMAAGAAGAARLGLAGFSAGLSLGRALIEEQASLLHTMLAYTSSFLGSPYAELIWCQAVGALFVGMLSELVYTSILGLLGGAAYGFCTGYVGAVKGSVRLLSGAGARAATAAACALARALRGLAGLLARLPSARRGAAAAHEPDVMMLRRSFALLVALALLAGGARAQQQASPEPSGAKAAAVTPPASQPAAPGSGAPAAGSSSQPAAAAPAKPADATAAPLIPTTAVAAEPAGPSGTWDMYSIAGPAPALPEVPAAALPSAPAGNASGGAAPALPAAGAAPVNASAPAAPPAAAANATRAVAGSVGGASSPDAGAVDGATAPPAHPDAPAAPAGLATRLSLALTAPERLPELGASFKDLDVTITPETAARLHVKIAPRGERRWEVPESIVPRPGASPGLGREELLYTVLQPGGRPGRPFALTVARKATLEPVFDTRGFTFLFKGQYIELTTRVPRSAHLYGLGETTLTTGLLLPRDGKVVTLWNRDIASAYTDFNLYGSHPFLLQVNRDGSSHGVFFLNSNGMDVILNPDSVTYKVIGGLVDLYFFMGPTPEAVIGRPVMAPYWALGLHQSKWGYQNVSVLEAVVANYSAAGLPLESLWVDIEYMASRFRSMTFDEDRFPIAKMRALVARLHAAGRSWVPILDPAVSMDARYRAYTSGSAAGVWLRDAAGAPYVGQVPFDGLWLDMNEPSNFCTGMRCRPDPANKTATYWLNLDTPKDYGITRNMLVKNRTTCQMVCEPAAATNALATPPYAIHNLARTHVLSRNIVHPTALHADGATEYDAHNLYGTAMAMRHHAAALAVNPGRRPFILTRSTSPGAGRFAGHWTGDNAANWENLYYSIAGILNSNMWGMAMTGWPDVAAAAKKAYGLRYSLLTYIYGSLARAHAVGGTLARPLLFADPSDVRARNATSQWMLGEAVLVSPVITPNTTTIHPHFTAGNWYSAWDLKRLTVEQGRGVRLDVPYGDVPVHIRGGAIVPWQAAGAGAAVTRDVRFAPVTLLVALPRAPATRRQAAAGGPRAGVAPPGPLPPYALDAPCSDVLARGAGKLVWYAVTAAPGGRSGSLENVVAAAAPGLAGRLTLAGVTVLGVPGTPADEAVVTVYGGAAGGAPPTAVYDASAEALRITGLALDAGAPLNIDWRVRRAAPAGSSGGGGGGGGAPPGAYAHVAPAQLAAVRDSVMQQGGGAECAPPAGPAHQRGPVAAQAAQGSSETVPGSSPDWRGANLKTRGRAAPSAPPAQLGAGGWAAWTAAAPRQESARRHFHDAAAGGAETAAADGSPPRRHRRAVQAPAERQRAQGRRMVPSPASAGRNLLADAGAAVRQSPPLAAAVPASAGCGGLRQHAPRAHSAPASPLSVLAPAAAAAPAGATAQREADNA
ncbi:alpha-glucosidase [Scenedesmus sp. PABB004]|nr:alpha-glucosidase [Scenedesmus sp. PABB004]